LEGYGKDFPLPIFRMPGSSRYHPLWWTEEDSNLSGHGEFQPGILADLRLVN